MVCRINLGIIRRALISLAVPTVSLFLACDDLTTSGTGYQPPRTLNGVFEGNAVELNWQRSENYGETGYEIWRAVGYQENYKKIKAVGKSDLKYTDKNIELNKKYYYKVRTLYGANDGPFSNEIYLETVPEAPRNCQVYFNGSAFELSWQASPTGAETGYEIWRKPDGGSYVKVAELPKDRKDFTDTVITKGKYNFYKLRTIYGSEPGQWAIELPALANYLWAVNYVNKFPFYKITTNTYGLPAMKKQTNIKAI
jgi:hypothetical protein